MITYIEALVIAQHYVGAFNPQIMGATPVILESETIEFSLGWVFVYTSKEFLKTGDYSYMLAGNAPIIIDKRNGKLTETGTVYSIEYYIKEYERTQSE